ncbi:MAG TPA: hypothetical protein VJM10_04175 [Candidatus Methylomirabilis sp.]|nr:hypothetical protein [Candidatus Methylomirabilis sp.]
MTHRTESLSPSPLRKLGVLGVLVWVSMIAVDFFLHAGLLASLYVQPSPFLLPPEAAFALIPLGYLSFILFAVILLWLAAALRLIGARAGFIFGLKLGALIWGAVALGLASVSTASPALLLGWFVGQTVEMGIGGAVAGEGLQRDRLRPLVFGVVLLLLASILLTIILQSLGLAPAARVL